MKSPLEAVAGISFDLWDTLVHHEDGGGQLQARRVSLLAEETGCESTHVAASMRRRFEIERHDAEGGAQGVTVVRRMDLLVAELGGDADRAASLAERVSEEALDCHPIPAPGAETALKALSARWPLVLVSNTRWTSGETLRRLLSPEHLDLDRFFQGRVFSDEAGWAKPSPEIFRLVWQPLGIPPERTIHIGDRVKRDVLGAEHCGARAIVCRALRRRRERGDGLAEAVFYDFEAAPAAVNHVATGEPPAGWRLVVEGLPIWGRVVAGRASIVREPGRPVPPGRILALKNSSLDHEPSFEHAAAILAESGGYGSHAAQTAPIWDVPCVVGLEGLLARIREDALLLVDGTRGRVYQREGDG